METQKTSNSQNNQERKMQLEESNFLTSDYATKLQSSEQCGTDTKTDSISMGQYRKPRNKSTHP